MRWLFLLILLIPQIAFGAGSSFIVSSDEVVTGWAGTVFRVLTLTFVADDSDGSIPSLEINGKNWSDGTNSGELPKGNIYSYGYNVEIYGNSGGTEVTENSDLYIYQNGVDILGAGGADQVDNTSDREIFFKFGGSKVTRPVYSKLTITIEQEATATNSATGSLKLLLTP